MPSCDSGILDKLLFLHHTARHLAEVSWAHRSLGDLIVGKGNLCGGAIYLQGITKETFPIFFEDFVALFSALPEVGWESKQRVNKLTQSGKVSLVIPCTAVSS